MPSDTFSLLTAEIFLACVAIAIYVAGAFHESRRVWAWIGFGAMVTAACVLWLSAPTRLADGPMVFDSLAYYARWLSVIMGGIFMLLATRREDSAASPEHVGSLILTIVGLMLVASSSELVGMFLALELVSVPTYVMLYLARRDQAGQESAAKYFFLSLLAGAMLLYGFSFLYGATGSTDLRIIRSHLGSQASAIEPGGLFDIGKIALVLIFAGLGFKITAVPFQFYAPDVYQGTTHFNAGFLSVVPKIAGFVALVRIVAIAMPDLEPHAWRIAMALAMLTMTFGNVMALWQTNLRRLLAYSGIAHAGYMLIGLAAYLGGASTWGGHWGNGVAALLFYLVIYSVTTAGTFAALACFGRQGRQVDDIEELAGLAWTEGVPQRVLAWTLALFMFSLAGIPPLAGFWGKLILFYSALSVQGDGRHVGYWFLILAVVGALNAAIAAAYYLRIVGLMFFRMPLGSLPTKPNIKGPLSAALICAAVAIILGIFPGPLVNRANRASPYTLPPQEVVQASLPDSP